MRGRLSIQLGLFRFSEKLYLRRVDKRNINLERGFKSSKNSLSFFNLLLYKTYRWATKSMEAKNFIEITDIPERRSLKGGCIYPKKYERRCIKMWWDSIRAILVYKLKRKLSFTNIVNDWRWHRRLVYNWEDGWSCKAHKRSESFHNNRQWEVRPSPVGSFPIATHRPLVELC